MTDPFPAKGRLAGIDFGTVRIGIAVSDPDQTMAMPHENYTRGDTQTDARRFCRLVEEDDIVGFVVGLPVHTSGNESQKSLEARQFGQWLAETTDLPVCFYDERYSSAEAERILEGANLTSKRRKARRDMLAAQIMLSAYLESDDRGQSQPGAIDD